MARFGWTPDVAWAATPLDVGLVLAAQDARPGQPMDRAGLDLLRDLLEEKTPNHSDTFAAPVDAPDGSWGIQGA